MEWKRSFQNNNCFLNLFPSSFSVQSNLPPDDRSYGFERGIAIDRAWDQSITDVAIEFAEIAVEDLFPAYQKRRGQQNDLQTNLRGFLAEFLGIAFRRSIDDEIRSNYIDQALEIHGDDAAAVVQYVVLKALKSPRFLYPLIDDDQPHSRRAANRLALVLFDSLPSDQWLIDRIEEQDQLTKEQLAEAAWKMVNDYRAQAKIRSFLYHWLDLEDLGEITKDNELFPGFDPQLTSDLKKSLDEFLDEVVQSESSDFRQLLQADWGFTNDRIAQFYGDRWKSAEADDSDQDFRKSVSDPDTACWDSDSSLADESLCLPQNEFADPSRRVSVSIRSGARDPSTRRGIHTARCRHCIPI